MRLAEAEFDQKLSLDVTPLIDVVFLLVLFFAVTTSFISAEDLTALKDSVVLLAGDKQALSTANTALSREVEEREAAVARLEEELLVTEAEGEKLAWMMNTLEQEQVTLKRSLEESSRQSAGLQEQLEQAFRDYQSLDLELAGVRTARDAQAENERLIRSLLLEREQQLDEALVAKLSLAAERDTLIEAGDVQAEQERVLQALLIERAARLEGLEEQLVAAQSHRASLTDTVSGMQAAQAESSAEATRTRTEMLKLRNDLAKYRKVAELDAAEIERILDAQEKLKVGLADELASNQLGITLERQRLVLQLSDQILFDSGSAVIKSEGLEVLRSVGNIIKLRAADLNVLIGGHTDNIPIAGRSGLLGSNWGLSAARAVNVVRFLEDQVGLDSGRLSAVGYGEHRPVASNDTPTGRSRNRRIEIVLVPK